MKNKNDILILVVDDDPDMCKVLKRIMQNHGFSAEIAQSGEEVLSLTSRRYFSLVFLDVKLPDIDGFELVKRMREIDPNIRIVLFSGYYYSDDADIQKALQEELIYAFIAKPFPHEEIAAILKSLYPNN